MPDAPAGSVDRSPLPSVLSPLSGTELVARLETASKRGRLAGFARAGGGFEVSAFATPFDHALDARLSPADGGTRVEFSLRMFRKMPVIASVVTAATVWPGVHFVDQLIPGRWGWIPTWWWYVPLSVLPLPWAARTALRRSRATAHASALDMIGKIAAESDGRVVRP
jgi:hypothetical protein